MLASAAAVAALHAPPSPSLLRALALQYSAEGGTAAAAALLTKVRPSLGGGLQTGPHSLSGARLLFLTFVIFDPNHLSVSQECGEHDTTTERKPSSPGSGQDQTLFGSGGTGVRTGTRNSDWGVRSCSGGLTCVNAAGACVLGLSPACVRPCLKLHLSRATASTSQSPRKVSWPL